MKKLISLFALATALLAGTPALADGYRHQGYHDHHRYRHDHRDRHHWDRHDRGKHHGWKHAQRYSRDHRGHYYPDHRGYYVIYRDHDRDYYKWIGGAIIIGEILHHSHR